MKKIFLSILLMLLPVMANAYDVEINGIYYYLNSVDKKATVTYMRTWDVYPYRGSSYKETHYYSGYSGDIIIPPSIQYDGDNYDVTSIGEHAFHNCSDLISISIPNTITYISIKSFVDNN